MSLPENQKQSFSKEEVRELFADYFESKNPEIRETLVEKHMNLVHFFARRFMNRGEQMDDLVQVGTVGLINAIDRFQPDKGAEFITFATVTILGEIKRYFRDKTWGVKVPRRIKDLNIQINQIVEKLTRENGAAPTYEKIAEELGTTIEEVLESREAIQSYRLVSLHKDMEGDSGDGATPLMDLIGTIDNEIELIGDKLMLQSAMKTLKEDEKFVIYYKHFQNLSQAEIAKMMNVSQMQVSRIQAAALKKLHGYMAKE